jgi:hypothetical protein
MNTLIDIETPFGPLEDIPAEFDVEVEKLPAEDFALAENYIHVSLHSIQLNDLTLDHDQTCAFLGRPAVGRLETHIAETYEP